MELTKIWKIAPEISPEAKKTLSAYPPLVAQLLYNRGLVDQLTVRHFFSADWQLNVHDPFAFQDMKWAVDLIVAHLKDKHLIAVAGDYDADGITSSAVIQKTIQAIGGRCEVWIPSRLGEGYGLSKLIIDQVIEAGAKLLITVDNGVRAANEVAYALSKGLQVIVTDHHMGSADDAIWPAAPLIDPILPIETYPFRYLAGVGVAFKLMSALLAKSTLAESQKDRFLEQILDLVAIGTIADCVSLTGENRALVRRGLEQVNRQQRPGVKSLIESAGVKGPLNEWNIGWQIAPRLNVAGRMDHANTALQLLTTDSQAEADELAGRLNGQNVQRQTETARIVEHCERYIDENLQDDHIIVVTSPDLGQPEADKWLEGVIGLVAGRLCEKYSRPTLVMCYSEGQIKGSGRSISSVDIVDFLGNFKEHLVRFGGHKMACGFTVKSKEDLAEFVAKARKLAIKTIPLEALQPQIAVDAELDLAQISGELIEQIEKFAPFGQGNPVPQFVSCGVRLTELTPLGAERQHLRLRFGSLGAIAFNAAKRWPELTSGQLVDIVYTADWNEFNGYKNLQLKIVDLKVVAE